MKSFLIGSLPHEDVESALDYSFSFDIPTLVTLPKIDSDEFMVDQALREIDGYIYKRHSLREGGPSYGTSLRFLAEDAFFSRLTGDFKWQACGPLTLAASLEHHPGTEEILERYFSKLVQSQREFASVSKGKSYVFLDEPALAFEEAHVDVLEGFLTRMRDETVFSDSVFGLHCCSKVSFETMIKLGFDFFSIDPSLYSAEELAAIQEGLGSRLVFTPVDSKGEPIQYKRQGELLASSACGLALSSLEQCALVKSALLSCCD